MFTLLTYAALPSYRILYHFVPVLLCNNCCQTIDATAKICVTAGNVIVANLAQINHSD